MAASASPIPEHRLICRVCQKQFSQYTCPRCNLRYCSLHCYKSHSARCVESFMQDNVMGEMRDLGATAETKGRMMEALKRFHMEHGNLNEEDPEMGSDDDDRLNGGSTCLSEKTLAKIAAGEHIELDELTKEEKRAFLQAVAAGEFSHMIQPWDPWWQNPMSKTVSVAKQGNSLIQFVNEKDQFELEEHKVDDVDVPAPFKFPLPSIKQLTHLEPSPLLGVHLVEIVYSYCFILRLYNGDWHSDPIDAAMACLCVSQVLGKASSPESITEALGHCLESICSASFRSAGGRSFGMALLDDTSALLRLGRPGVICSFADLYRLLDAALVGAKEEFEPELGEKVLSEPKSQAYSSIKHLEKIQSRGDSTRSVAKREKVSCRTEKADRKKLRRAWKKVYFLSCWANEQSDDAFFSLTLLVDGEKTYLLESDRGSAYQLAMKTGTD